MPVSAPDFLAGLCQPGFTSLLGAAGWLAAGLQFVGYGRYPLYCGRVDRILIL